MSDVSYLIEFDHQEIGTMKRRQRNHLFWSMKFEGHSTHKMPLCVPGPSCDTDAVGLLVCLHQPDGELPGLRDSIYLGLIHPVSPVLGTEEVLSKC